MTTSTVPHPHTTTGVDKISDSDTPNVNEDDKDQDQDQEQDNDKEKDYDDVDEDVPPPGALACLSACIRAVLSPLLRPGQGGIDIDTLLNPSPNPNPTASSGPSSIAVSTSTTSTPVITDRLLLRILHTYARVLETIYEKLKDKQDYFDWRKKRGTYRRLLAEVGR